MKLTHLSDSELVKAYVNGDEKSFEILLLRHKSKIYSTIFLLVKDTYIAEDIFQNTFIKIINTLKKGRYNDEGKFLPWALRIAHNLCIDYFRIAKRKPIVKTNSGEDILNFIASNVVVETAESTMDKEQSSDKLMQLIYSLPEDQREVVVLRHFVDLSFKEIAAFTGVSINTALGRMRYALINLRKIITEKEISLR